MQARAPIRRPAALNGPLTVGGGGFTTSAVIPNWNSFGLNLTYARFGTTNPGLYPNTPLGMVGTVYSDDPNQSGVNCPSNGKATCFNLMYNQWTNSRGANAAESDGHRAMNIIPTRMSPTGCGFSGGQSTKTPNDFQWWPLTDVYGNQLNPANAYLPVTNDDRERAQNPGPAGRNEFGQLDQLS